MAQSHTRSSHGFLNDERTHVWEMHMHIMLILFHFFSFLGFLVLPDGTIGSGNFGYLDQVTALEWIQQNIAAFGGDPNR